MKIKKISCIAICLGLIITLCSFVRVKFNKNDYHNFLNNPEIYTQSGIIHSDEYISLINCTNFNDFDFVSKKEKKLYFIYNLKSCKNLSKNKWENANCLLLDYSRNIPSEFSIVLDGEYISKLSSNLPLVFDYMIEENEKQNRNSNDVRIKAFNNNIKEIKPVWNSRSMRINIPFGYLDVGVNVSKLENTEYNSLYFAQFSANFTPGIVASRNGEKEYENYLLQSGYFHVEAMQAVEDLGPADKRLGGIPYFKDAYPTSSTGMVTITSSVDKTFTFGTSFDNGFSTSNGYEIKNGLYNSTSVNLGYSKALTISDPLLSTQRSPSNSKEYQWNFNVQTKEVSSISYMLNCGYLYDMDETHSETYKDAIQLHFKYHMTLKQDTWFFPKTVECDGFDTFMFP